MLISSDEAETRVAILADGVLDELQIERRDQPRLAGSIFKGTVSSVVSGMDAAFVDVGLSRDGFLHVTDVMENLDALGEMADTAEDAKGSTRRPSISSILRKGQEVMVQVLKEPMGTKGVRLSSCISLPGRFLVLMPTVTHTGVSRRVASDKERARLKDLLREIQPEGLGFIARTAAEGQTKKALLSDLRYLQRLWEQIKKRSRRSRTPAQIHEELGIVERMLRDQLLDDIGEILVDRRTTCVRARRFLRAISPGLEKKVKLTRTGPLFERYGLEKEVEKILGRRVFLPSGGYIVIDQTEALVSVDVNSGRHTRRQDLEKTALETNLEATKEITRQFRLRDLGGIIVIDFIDMEVPRNRRRLLTELRRGVERDKAKTTILPVSRLGLVQMTRQRIRQNVSRVFTEDCPYCHGRGIVLSAATVSIRLRRHLRRVLGRTRERRITVVANPLVAARLEGEDKREMAHFRRRFRRRIYVEADEGMHVEEFRFLGGRAGTALELDKDEGV